MLLEGRNWEGGSEYRYGFNGKESDKETYGDGNVYDYGFRVYNPRLGKFLSVDPLTKNYPWYTPYQFAGNKPIAFVDLDGREDYYYTLVWDENGQNPVISLQKVSNDLIPGFISAVYINGVYQADYLTPKSARQHGKFYYGKMDLKTFNAVYEAGQKILEEHKAKVAADVKAFEEYAIYHYAVTLPPGTYSSPGTITPAKPKYVKASSTASQDNRQGAFSYAIKDGNLSFKNSMSTKGQFDVVVTIEGKLLIGDGHYKMTGNAKQVIAAGSIIVNEKGVVTSFSNSSGHYKTDKEGLAVLQKYLLDANLINKNTPNTNAK